MSEKQQTVDYLKDNRAPWRNSLPFERPNLFDLRVPETTTTFFRGVRSSAPLRLYGWGNIGVFNPGPVPVTTGMSGTNFQATGATNLVDYRLGYGTGSPIFASDDAEDQLFPNLATPSGIRRWSLHAPNTEEFLVRGAVHDPLQNVVSIAGVLDPGVTSTGVNPDFVLACTAEGHLYSCGILFNSSTDTAGNRPDTSRHIGLGPDFPDVDLFFPWFRLNRYRQHALQRVYGPDADFVDVKFVKVAANNGRGTTYSHGTSVALDADGYLWFAGDSTGVADANGFATNSMYHPYFEKYVVSEWREDKNAISTGGPLLFKDFWLSGPAAFQITNFVADAVCLLLAITADGRLFQVGRPMGTFANRAGEAPEKRVFHEITGFVDEIEVTNPGSGYTSVPGVILGTAGGGGRNATAVAIRDAATNTITHVRITDPGWGYDSAPAVTFSGGGGTGAAATCHLFTRKWKTAAVAYAFAPSRCAAICENGVLYTWIRDVISNEANPTTFLPSGSGFIETPLRAHAYNASPGAVFEKVAVGLGVQERFGIALDVDGKAYYWGASTIATGARGVTPDCNRKFVVTPLSDVDATLGAFEYVDVVCASNSVALVRNDNSVWTYGRSDNSGDTAEGGFGPALGRGRETYDSEIVVSGRRYKSIGKIVGSDVWSKVFVVGLNAYMATRLPEELDPMYGVRVNPLPPYQAPAP